MITVRSLLAGIFLLSSVSCSAHFEPSSQRDIVRIIVDGDAKGKCAVHFDGQDETLPADLGRAAQEMYRRQPQAEIHIVSTLNTRWECMGDTMTALSKAGFKQIGFVSQPDPDKR